MTESSKPPSGRRMKAHAPPPPQAPQPAPRRVFRNTVPDGGGTSGMDAKENILRPTVDLQLTLPHGERTSVTEDGSKALMDLLVDLCSRYHLNPALHTLELLSPEGHTLGFKPNALLGSLDVACVLIKEKVWEDKVVRRPAPKAPEKTVRLMVNYHGSQKAVVRVNPLVPLQALIPVICEKCDFDPAHVLLLRDNISRYELPPDKSLTELGIKELYVHDQSLVLQPKMASAPALNHSDSIHSSTTSLGRPEKKGLLGIFQFKKKSKTETTSVDMDDQHTDRKSGGLSPVSGHPSIEDRPSTLGQSQSVMNITKMSPKAETKKRRAPALPGAPTPSMIHASSEVYQASLGSESLSLQRKRKAPAPPPTPSSTTPGPDDTSTSAIPTPDSHAIEKTPTPSFRTKVAESTTVTTVVMQTVKPVPLKNAEQPPPVSAPTPPPSSPTPSSSTTNSLAVQDSSSELSHSLDDSDADPDQTGSQYSSLTSSTVSESVVVQTIKKSSSSRMGKSEKASSKGAKLNEEVTSDSSSRSETDSDLNLKLDEVENNRHSAMGTTDLPVPAKPRHFPVSPTLSSLPIEPTESTTLQKTMEENEAATQSWLHSMQNSTANGQKPETGTPEVETMSLASSSGSSSHDQGYAASEGMAEGEDSGMVSSPSETQPTSPDGSLSLDGNSRGTGGRLLGPVRDVSSDSDEGWATWESRHRHNDSSSRAKSGKFRDSYEDDPELTAEISQTLANFEANLVDHTNVASVRETSYTMSTHSKEVPVSVVDMDVPVTAIDEVLEDYEHNIAENEAKSLTRSESTGSKGPDFYRQSSVEPQNKNNNACTAADGNKSSSSNSKQQSQPQQHRKSPENKSKVDKKKEKMPETKMKETSITNTNVSVKKDKQRTSTVKPIVDLQKHSRSTEIKPEPVKSNTQSFHEKKSPPSPTSQRTVSPESNKTMHRGYQNSSSNILHSKVTHNVTSRFGMKTFTVVPPKPTVIHDASEVPAVTSAVGAIKIDDQGNMVRVGVSHNKVGGSSDVKNNHAEESPPLGKVKAFWSSNERQESAVSQNKGLNDKTKESTNDLKSTLNAVSGTTWKTSNTEDQKTTNTLLSKLAERAQSKEMIKDEAREPAKDLKVSDEEWVGAESKISVSSHIQQPRNKPTIPPYNPSDLRKDLPFLKPPRRTSSQFVASAINKYPLKTSANPNSFPNVPDSSVSLKTQIFERSIQVSSQQSSQSSSSDDEENESAVKSNLPGPKRSMSYPEYVPVSQRNFGEVRVDREELGSRIGSIKGNSNTLETETAKNKHIQSNGPTQRNLTASDVRKNIKHMRPRSPSPAQSSPLHSLAKPPTAPKIIFQGQTSNTRDIPKVAKHPTPDGKPQPPVTETDSSLTPGPSPVTVFGPVKKFRPVIHRSVEKETSLHSSLMEAIQTGGGKEKLKKVMTPDSSVVKKASYVDEENERSALLAAIRAQSTSARLRKTKSMASHEVEKLRKASEEERSADPPPSPSPPPFTRTSPSPVFAPLPQPPPAPMMVPPPPPPLSPQGKPSTVSYSSANAPMNPALAREAMLEAIRSGAAAEGLKKVAVPIKTVKVNGRLGTKTPSAMRGEVRVTTTKNNLSS